MSRSQMSCSPLPQLAVPVEWKLRRLKFFSNVQVSNVDKKSVDGEVPVRLCNYLDVYKNDEITPTMEFMDASATDAQIENFSLKKGDVLITKDSEAWDDIAVPAVVAADLPGVVCGYHLAHIRPNPTFADGRYLARCFAAHGIAEQFFLAANGITRFGLGKDEITGSWFPLPPLATQRRIAAYLDREATRIDALISAKERLLLLLAEKRQALITHAVTRGLNPDAPVRDSGLPWLGMIPEHWELKRLKYVVGRIEQGTSPQCYNFPANDGERGVLKTGCVNGGIFNENENKALPPDTEPELQYEVAAGDVLMSRASGSVDLIGSVAMVQSAPRARLQLSDKTFRMIVDIAHFGKRFFVMMMGSQPLRTQIQIVISGAEGLANNLPQSEIREFVLPMPPRAEQDAIVEATSNILCRIDETSISANRTLDLLRERRSALIAAAVTGQIEVEG